MPPLSRQGRGQKKISWITTAIATSVQGPKSSIHVFRAQIYLISTARLSPRFVADNAKAKLGVEAKDVKVMILHEDGPYGVGVAQAT
jgi:branched-chain amino acid transport system substrate-binding protein